MRLVFRRLPLITASLLLVAAASTSAYSADRCGNRFNSCMKKCNYTGVCRDVCSEGYANCVYDGPWSKKAAARKVPPHSGPIHTSAPVTNAPVTITRSSGGGGSRHK